jgi:KDO2-lipid IV(A) lauroyltransferase
MTQALGYYLFYAFAWTLALFPLRLLYAFSRLLYYLVYYVIGYRKKVVFMNLQNSFPGKTDKEINHIAKKFYKHFADVVIEVVKMIHFNKRQLNKHIRFKNMEVFDQAFNNNKHVIAVIGHYGNWEWTSAIANHMKHRSLTVYKPLHNKYFNSFMIGLREKFGMELLPFNQTFRKLIGYYNEGELTATGFIADQSPVWEDIQYWTDFLNQDTPVYLSVEKIARKMNATVVFFKQKKIKRGCYELEVIKIVDHAKETPAYDITEKHTRILEQSIKDYPELWLWTHRRWKRKRNTIDH